METVYLPEEDSYLMQEVIEDYLKTLDRRPKTVLDMGTGSGILAIAAAKQKCSVTAADINPAALKFAKENAQKEKVEIKFIESNLFSNIDGKFDLIVFNPPYVPTEDTETRDLQSAAWDGGPDGMEVINSFLFSVSSYLEPDGKIILLVSSTDDNIPKIPNFKTRLLKKKSYFFERLYALLLLPQKG